MAHELTPELARPLRLSLSRQPALFRYAPIFPQAAPRAQSVRSDSSGTARRRLSKAFRRLSTVPPQELSDRHHARLDPNLPGYSPLWRRGFAVSSNVCSRPIG